MTEKKRALFINYLIWIPEQPNFAYKFELLSSRYEGALLHLSSGHRKKRAGSFNMESAPYFKNVVIRQLYYIFFCLKYAYRANPVDYIISYDPLICGFIGVLARALTGAKLIIEVNTDHFESMSVGESRHKYAFKKCIMRFCFKYSDAVKFINSGVAKKYSDFFKLDNSKIKRATFFSFISTHVFKKTGPAHKKYILIAGHPYYTKGVDVMIRAFNLISDLYPDITLRIIGHCEDKSFYESLAEGNQRIEFRKGVHFDEMATEVENCAMIVLPSRTESMGRVLIEAMACGKPVIGSNVGGIPEVIEDGVNGFLFESGDHEMLANRIDRILGNPDLAMKLGEAAYRTATERYSPGRYVELYHSFLSTL